MHPSQHQIQCHCGNVSITFEVWPESVTSCNCSVCGRYAALWGYYEPASVKVKTKQQATTAYRWGDGMIDFHHCSICGCVTHYTSTDQAPKPKVALNFRMALPDALSLTKVRYFDGADSWQYLNK
ncbi:GFA family protein [Vibrio parahaemolyticus]|uniref:GFA family protein n=1 Tax=Vibrio mediterranei TaxID=689 RepID=UPI00406907E6